LPFSPTPETELARKETELARKEKAFEAHVVKSVAAALGIKAEQLADGGGEQYTFFVDGSQWKIVWPYGVSEAGGVFDRALQQLKDIQKLREIEEHFVSETIFGQNKGWARLLNAVLGPVKKGAK